MKKIKHNMRHTRFGRVFHTTMIFVLISIATYAFLSLVNWSYQLPDWNGFSRFLLACIGIVYIIKLIDES